MIVSRLKRVPIRRVWKKEQKDFTPWLKENIDILEEALNMKLSVIEREVGEHFKADLLAEGSNGDYVVIENQFGKSDHDHLGKLITYLTNLEAKNIDEAKREVKHLLSLVKERKYSYLISLLEEIR